MDTGRCSRNSSLSGNWVSCSVAALFLHIEACVTIKTDTCLSTEIQQAYRLTLRSLQLNKAGRGEFTSGNLSHSTLTSGVSTYYRYRKQPHTSTEAFSL